MLPERIKELYDSGLLEESKKMFSCIRNRSDFVNFNTGEVEMDYNSALNVWWFYRYSKDFEDCLKIIHADNRRYNRLFARIKWIMDLGTCIFFTLTFTDEVLSSTTEKQRRRYVQMFCKRNSNMYIANIDFGKQKGREHYHGIMLCSDPSIVEKWEYGYSNAKIVHDNKEDTDRLSRYILKIANHFVKESVKRNYVIYSRNHIDIKDNSNDYIKFYIGDQFKEMWKIVENVDIEKNIQLQFWEHLPRLFNENMLDFD